MKRVIGLIFLNLFFIVLLGLTTPYFLTKANWIVLINNFALEAIALSGYTLLLIGGNFDLSVDGIVSLSGIIAGLLMVNGVAWYLAVGCALFVAVSVGMINGIVVAKIGVNGLIATLTTWWMCVGIGLGLTKGLTPYNFPEVFQLFGQSRILGFRFVVLYALVIVVILSIVLHYTRMGAHLYVAGDNRQSAEMLGINTTKLGIKMYVLVGLLSGFIGLIIASRLNAASPIAVDGMALRVIAAIVIGGGVLGGGKGSVIGGLLGLSIMHILGNSIIQLGISPYWQKVVLGSVLLVAVLSEKLKFRIRSVRNV